MVSGPRLPGRGAGEGELKATPRLEVLSGGKRDPNSPLLGDQLIRAALDVAVAYLERNLSEQDPDRALVLDLMDQLRQLRDMNVR